MKEVVCSLDWEVPRAVHAGRRVSYLSLRGNVVAQSRRATNPWTYRLCRCRCLSLACVRATYSYFEVEMKTVSFSSHRASYNLIRYRS